MPLNQWGLIVGWACDTANVYDSVFHPLIEQVCDNSNACDLSRRHSTMIVLGDTHFHAQEGDPDNLKICLRGEWNVRMLVETVLSMLTTVCHIKKLAHRVWEYFQAHLGFAMAAFNLLVQWDGLHANEDGFVPLSIAEFSL